MVAINITLNDNRKIKQQHEPRANYVLQFCVHIRTISREYVQNVENIHFCTQETFVVIDVFVSLCRCANKKRNENRIFNCYCVDCDYCIRYTYVRTYVHCRQGLNLNEILCVFFFRFFFSMNKYAYRNMSI